MNAPSLFDLGQAPSRRTKFAGGETGKDQALRLLEAKRASVVAALREEAHSIFAKVGMPLSTNDIRHVLKDNNYGGDPRILGAAFVGWNAVGWTKVSGNRGNSRSIRLFVPKAVDP